MADMYPPDVYAQNASNALDGTHDTDATTVYALLAIAAAAERLADAVNRLAEAQEGRSS